MTKMDERTFIETLRHEETAILSGVMNEAIRDFANNIYERIHSEYTNGGSKLMFVTTFKNYAHTAPFEVVFHEDNKEHVTVFEKAIDELCKKLKKKTGAETDIENFSRLHKIDIACMLMEGHIGLLEGFETVMNKYYKKCKEICDPPKKKRRAA